MAGFDVFIVAIVLITFFRGYSTGLVMQLAMLVGLILGAVFAGKISSLVAPHIISFIHGTPHIVGPMAYIIAFAIIIVAILYIGRMLTTFLKVIHLSPLNKLTGGIFSSLKWLVITSILLNLIVEIDQTHALITDNTRTQAYTYSLVIEMAQMVVPYLRFDWA